jgi:hypothetical protein
MLCSLLVTKDRLDRYKFTESGMECHFGVYRYWRSLRRKNSLQTRCRQKTRKMRCNTFTNLKEHFTAERSYRRGVVLDEDLTGEQMYVLGGQPLAMGEC